MQVRPFDMLCRALCALGVMQALSFGSPALAEPAGPPPTGVAIPAAPDAPPRLTYEDFTHGLALQALRGMNADKSGPATPAAASASAPAACNQRPLDLTLHFSAIDTNRDGRISLDELKQAIAQHPDSRKLFQSIDLNGDGELDSLEIDRLRVVPQIDIQF